MQRINPACLRKRRCVKIVAWKNAPIILIFIEILKYVKISFSELLRDLVLVGELRVFECIACNLLPGLLSQCTDVPCCFVQTLKLV